MLNCKALDNKYARWYNIFVEKAKLRNWTRETAMRYVEKHHIHPRCLGGDNSSSNLVYLTAKEHYVFHHLLTKMFEGSAKGKMIYAFWYLSNNMISSYRRRIDGNPVNARTFEIYRKEISVLASLTFKGKKKSAEHTEKIAKNNRQRALTKNYWLGRHHKIETKEKLRIANLNKKQSQETRNKRAKSHLGKKHSIESKAKREKEIVLINPSGEVQIIKGLKRFCQENGLNYANMFNVKRGRIKRYKGWRAAI